MIFFNIEGNMTEKIKKTGGAPKGNQNAVGYGRPPNPGYSDEEVLRLGKELISWMIQCDKDPNCDIVHLSEWYSEIKNMPRSQWQAICVRACFLPYYERAKEWMGKRILKNKDLPTAYGSRFLGIYFSDIREHEREIAEHKIDYEISKKSALEQQKGISPNDDLLSKLFINLKNHTD
jgi:hypothetical protein